MASLIDTPADAGTKQDIPDDPRGAIRIGNAIIYLGLGLFIAWAMVAPLDEGVSAQGVVSVETVRKVVSHLGGGSISTINVRENQMVHAGDILLTLDSAKVQNALDSVLQEYIAAAAKHARLTAEKGMEDNLAFPDELIRLADEAKRRDILVGQERLFRIRRQSLNNELAILRESLASTHGQVASARAQLVERSREAGLVREELINLKPLVEEGYSARTRLVEQERALAVLNSSTSELQGRVHKEIGNAAEIQLRMLQRRKEFIKEAESLLADSQRETTTLYERLEEARRDVERTIIRAPSDGQVIALQAQTPGAALTPGAKVLEIVPANEKLLLDVKVPVHVIDKIKPGLTTHVRSAAFIDNPQLVVEGRVQSLSRDRHTPTSSTEQPYYLARVEITEQGIKELHGRQFRPGMPVEVVIKTGERSLAAYLMKPITRAMFNALQEP